MTKIVAVVERFPERELAVHRRLARDPAFGEICEDYGNVRDSLRHWEAKGPSGGRQAEDYRRILGDLEAEILRILDDRA